MPGRPAGNGLRHFSARRSCVGGYQVPPLPEPFLKLGLVSEGQEVEVFGREVSTVWPDDRLEIRIYLKACKERLFLQRLKHGAPEGGGKIGSPASAVIE